MTAYARRSRLALAAVGRREREPGSLALVQVFSRLIGLPTLTLSVGSSHPTSDKNKDRDEDDSEWAQHFSENVLSGSTGYQPVPSGDSPDAMERVPTPIRARLQGIAVVPVAGSPTGPGESPGPPISKTRWQPQFHDG